VVVDELDQRVARAVWCVNGERLAERGQPRLELAAQLRVMVEHGGQRSFVG
jgi:hypothetical protein